jgi:Flp pilus assembly protein TadG
VRRIRAIWPSESGNAGIIFGLAVIPLLALGGGAVDLAYRGKIRGELQAASDTAAIAAARVLQVGGQSGESDEDALRTEAETKANVMLQAVLASMREIEDTDVAVTVLGAKVTIAAELNVKTSFLGLIGIDTLPAKAMAVVNLPEPVRMEIAMVLDYSGSMRDGDKYVRMTSAARDFVDRVERDRPEDSKIGIVPFSEFALAQVPGSALRGTAIAQANDAMTVCLSNRDYPYSATDETPYTAISGSRWPYVTTSDAKCAPYEAGGLQLRDLTDDFASLKNALSGMAPVGRTNLTLGTELGWHMLSPNQPFETAEDYGDEDLKKILILLTDGVQTVSATGPSGETSTLAADETTAELCANAREVGVRIFSIAYDVDDARVQDLLRGCASNSGSYFDARSVSDISGVFDEIYSQIAQSVWLSR